jgi:acetyltransferase-like isoleucine patch superfamily enzyme
MGRLKKLFKQIIKKNRMVMTILQPFFWMLDDIAWSRGRKILPLYIGNLLPDLFFFGRVRVLFFRLSGARIADIRTTLIRRGVFSENPGNLTIGSHFYVNRNTFLCGNGKILIGDFVRIAMNVMILTVSHEGKNNEIDIVEPVVIKDRCHISAGVIILPGSILEEDVFVCAGAVVSGTTKPGGLYVGNPARFVGYKKGYIVDPINETMC